MAFLDTLFKRWPYVALVVSAAMLAVAHAFQSFGGLEPCHLCLKEREVYWAAMAVSALAIAAGLTRFRAPAPRLASLALALVFAYGTGLAAFHAGAEWKWWPAPEGCSSTGPVAMPRPTAVAHRPMARGRSAGSKTLEMMESVCGMTAAPPRPIAARAKISCSGVRE